MPEQPNGGQNDPNTQTVSKADYDRLQSQMVEQNRSLENLRGELTSPDYLDYRAAKNAPRAAAPVAGTPINLSNMTLEQLQAVMAQSMAPTIQATLRPLLERMDNLDAQQELDIVMRKYEDFETYRDQVGTILNGAKNELTIEQAYLMAKATNPDAQPSAENPPAAGAPKSGPKGNERPSANVPVDGDTIKNFKTAQEAGNAAWQEVAAKHGLSGDTI